jgi:large subunit ribosomal protein L4
MEAQVFDITAKSVGTLTLDETIFGIEPNVPVMHQAHLRQRNNARSGTSNTLTRGDVRGGGRKPWRQKGTGRARQGSTRSPQWRGGGVVFGPHPRSYAQEMPKKMRRLAIRSVLSVKARDEQLVVVQGLTEMEPRTKNMLALLGSLPAAGERNRGTLIVIGPQQEQAAVYLSANNIPDVKVIRAGYVNIHDVLTHDRLLLTPEAVETIHSLWSLGDAKKEAVGG